jgi:hypothetical protein
MKSFEDAAVGQDQTCGGILTDQKSSATATVSVLASGAFQVVCQ